MSDNRLLEIPILLDSNMSEDSFLLKTPRQLCIEEDSNILSLRLGAIIDYGRLFCQKSESGTDEP